MYPFLIILIYNDKTSSFRKLIFTGGPETYKPVDHWKAANAGNGGGVLGGVFNSLALDMTASLPLWARVLVMVIILLLGHGITFALSMISAFVHPMRLTFVEFFKNADFAGGGKEYDPFRKLK